MKSAGENSILSIREAAKVLKQIGLVPSRHQLEVRVRRGDFPPEVLLKQGRRVYFRRDRLMDYVEGNGHDEKRMSR